MYWFRLSGIMIIFIFLAMACTQDQRPGTDSKMALKPSELQNLKAEKNKEFYKQEEFLDAVRFAGSVENEIISLIYPQVKAQSKQVSQLQILSLLLDRNNHIKTGPLQFDCQIFSFELQKMETFLNIYKKCESQPLLLAQVEKIGERYRISFSQSHWKYTIGDSALLGLKDKVCELWVHQGKLMKLNCENHIMTIGSGKELEEIRLDRYVFDRSQKQQILIQGGKYKDFIQRSKINITVPDMGKIIYKEKHIDIKDEFLDAKQNSSKTETKDFIPPAPLIEPGVEFENMDNQGR